MQCAEFALGRAKGEGLQAGFGTAQVWICMRCTRDFVCDAVGTWLKCGSPGAATSAIRQQARPASLLTGAMSAKGGRACRHQLIHLWAVKEGILKAAYEAARDDRVASLRVLWSSGAATEDCTDVQSRRGERILEL